MSYTLHVDEVLQADDVLIDQLRRKNYKFILAFLNTSYAFNFHTDQSGVAFESSINWCAQNSDSVEDAKQVLLRLFDAFYRNLPEPVKENLADLAEEIGYDPKRINLNRLKERSKELLSFGTITLASLWAQALTYVNSIRLPRKSVSRDRFRVAIPASMMMRRDDEYMLDIPREVEHSSLQS